MVCFCSYCRVSFSGNSKLKPIPEGLQNLTEFITEFIRDLAKTQIGEEEYTNGFHF